MFSRFATQPAKQLAARRMFSSSTRVMSDHGPVGPYSNLPFKVHNRKIPYGFIHFMYFATGLGIPFFLAYVQLKKSGQL